MFCPNCGKQLSDAAIVCVGCGHPMCDVQVTSGVPKWSPGVAAVLSFLIPGLGQLYKRQIFGGLMWFVIVIAGYAALILPGLLLHLFCVIGATMGNPEEY